MKWNIVYFEEALEDLKALDGSQRILVQKAIKKVSQNPVSIYEGGYGKPLGFKQGIGLTGCFKIKLKSSGLRIVYRIVKDNSYMQIIIIGLRADKIVYKVAKARLNKSENK